MVKNHFQGERGGGRFLSELESESDTQNTELHRCIVQHVTPILDAYKSQIGDKAYYDITLMFYSLATRIQHTLGTQEIYGAVGL